MQVYVLDEKGHYAFDEHHQQRSIELEPCSDCVKHQWSQDERVAIERAVKLVWHLADFERAVFHALGQCYSRSDWRHEYQLGRLAHPVKQPFECDSEQIGLLKGVVLLAAFVGPADIEIGHLVSVHRKLEKLTIHIHNDHRNEAKAPLAPLHWFGTTYPQWIYPEQLLRYLPDIRGKSAQEVADHLKHKWDALKRCKRCKDIIALYQDEDRPNGLCYECNGKLEAKGFRTQEEEDAWVREGQKAEAKQDAKSDDWLNSAPGRAGVWREKPAIVLAPSR